MQNFPQIIQTRPYTDMYVSLFPVFYDLFIIFFLMISIAYTPKCFGQQVDNYKECDEKSFNCRDLKDVKYPFYGGDRPDYCGHRGFQLRCQDNDIPLITAGEVDFRVLEITDNETKFKVAREDLWEDLCKPSPYNTSFDPNLFNYSIQYPNITIYQDCSVFGSYIPPNQFCYSPPYFSFYLPTNMSFWEYYATHMSCQNNITIPVLPQVFPSLSSLSSSMEDLIAALQDGFELLWSANNMECEGCIGSGGRCGYNTINSTFVCYCPTGIHDGKCGSEDSSISLGVKFIIAAALVVCLILVLTTSALCCRRRNNKVQRLDTGKRNDQQIQAFMEEWKSIATKQYSYSEIKKITNSFEEKLGQGGYGSVYRGKLPGGRSVAVKVLNQTKGDGQDFINEVSCISRTFHVNVVTLLGFCYNRRRALVYEFMPNGSLDKFLNRSGLSQTSLEWKRLYQIAVGIARGLEYLHRGCNTRIVHFDIKPHNILLDGDFCPKISDFGLAKSSEKKDSILSSINTRGTVGYIAPEVFSRQFGGVSHKSDVYSYGMMILEMVGVRKYAAQVEGSSDVYFPQWIYEHLELGKELSIQDFTSEEDEEMSTKMMIVGLWCIQTSPSDRPSMSKVVEMLEGSLHSLLIPPKPFMHSPTRSLNHPSASLSRRTDASESIYIHASEEA